jgi:hypothetical protein
MQRVLEVSTRQGAQVLIEIDETQTDLIALPESDAELQGGARDAVAKLREIGDSIAEACGAINQAVAERMQAAQPDEFTLEFGVKVGAEGGAIISKVSGEAALKVTATWRKA